MPCTQQTLRSRSHGLASCRQSGTTVSEKENQSYLRRLSDQDNKPCHWDKKKPFSMEWNNIIAADGSLLYANVAFLKANLPIQKTKKITKWKKTTIPFCWHSCEELGCGLNVLAARHGIVTSLPCLSTGVPDFTEGNDLHVLRLLWSSLSPKLGSILFKFPKTMSAVCFAINKPSQRWDVVCLAFRMNGKM